MELLFYLPSEPGGVIWRSYLLAGNIWEHVTGTSIQYLEFQDNGKRGE